MKIYVVRHGETDWNAKQRYQGQRDIPLNAAGTQQAKQVAERFANCPIDFLISSDLSRARATAEIVGGRINLPVSVNPLWRERDFGHWDGLTRAEIEAKYPKEWHRYREEPLTGGPKDGETLQELQMRAVKAVEWVLEQYPQQTGIVFSHGGLIRSLFGWIANDTRPRFRLDNGGVSLLTTSAGDLSVEFINDTSHLR
ncbi:MAG: histidine phosphatase family protein [Firmicutes bacterium]|nr:histidine phosphatase family protein [Bacillota bacterium]